MCAQTLHAKSELKSCFHTIGSLQVCAQRCTFVKYLGYSNNFQSLLHRCSPRARQLAHYLMLAIPKRKIKVWRLVFTYIKLNHRYSMLNCIHEVLQRITRLKAPSMALGD